jgi:holliday junction DNA helicase RuvA
MIGKLTGMVDHANQDGLILVDVGGVGYSVRVPLLVLPDLSGNVSLFIHTAVRDDAIDLYGFPDEDGLSFFKQLMSVSGIGPKTALSIMSVADAGSLRRAIAVGDAGALVKVFGLGKKSAERIVVELRDKVAAEHAARGIAPGALDMDGEVLEALMALGYSAQQARSVLKELGDDSSESVKERLSAALKRLGSVAVK